MTRVTSAAPPARRVGSRLRKVLKVAGAVTGGAAAWFVCCVLPILLIGGGTAAVTDALVRESWLMLLGGLAMAGAGFGYVRYRRSRRSSVASGESPGNQPVERS